MSPHVNFCFPLPEVLESERVKLTPFIVEEAPCCPIAEQADQQ